MNNYHGPRSLHVSELHLVVADLNRSTAFYRDALGFKVAENGDGSVDVSADGAKRLLSLTQKPGVLPRGKTAGLYHVAFLLPSRTALGGFLRRAIATQLPIQGAADHRVSEAIYLADPDGNGIEIYADTDDADWRDEAGRLDMGTDPFDYTGVYYAADAEINHMPAATVIGHLHLAVHDLERSKTFYRDVIGLAVTADTYPGAYFLSSAGYHHHLAVNAWERAAIRKGDRAGLVETTIVFPDCESVQASVVRANALGYAVTDHDGGRSCVDPDGTIVRFTVA